MHHHVILSSKCQNNCRFCATGALNHTLKPDKVIDFLDINDGDTVLLTGGEPTLYKGFKDVAKYIHDLGGEVEILTNSIKFADNKFCEDVAPYLDSAQCSFYSWSENVTTYLTRNKKAYVKTIEGIHNLIDSSVDVDIKTLVNLRPCYRTLDITVDKIINEFGAKTVWLSGCDFVGNLQTNHGLILPLKRCAPHINDAIDKATDCGVNIEVMYLPLCLMSKRNINLVISRPGGSEIGSYLSEGCGCDSGCYDHTYGDECDNCKLMNRCTGVWSKYMNLYNNGVI